MVSYTYDSAGNLLTRTDARGIVTTYGGYDALNRPTTISYSDGTPAVTLGYDAVANSTGQLTSISNSNSATTFTAFDALGWVTASSQQVNGLTYGFTYTYNLAGALTSETYPSGRVVTTGYDAANRPTTVGPAKFLRLIASVGNQHMTSFRVFVLSTVLVLACTFSFAQDPALGVPKSVVPKNGFVPSATVAVAVAEAVLIPVYGKQQIASDRPFKAELSGGVWDVTGSLHCASPESPCPGGTAQVKISKRTGEILFMTHYQ